MVSQKTVSAKHGVKKRLEILSYTFSFIFLIEINEIIIRYLFSFIFFS